jgi:branched-chain amino acid transport system ATP-binding protein
VTTRSAASSGTSGHSAAERRLLLEVEGMHAGYHGAEVIRDLSFTVREGEIVALLGANGAGKTTVLNALCGLGPWRTGSVDVLSSPGGRPSLAKLSRKGVAYVVEGGRSFGPMSVRENLELGALALGRKPRAATLERVCELFPILRTRADQLAGTLSGGERRMLAIGRALTAEPSLLLLDEPTAGLAPRVVMEIAQVLRQLAHEDGLGIVVADQSLLLVENLPANVHLLDRGVIRWTGASSAVRNEPDVIALIIGRGGSTA